MKGFRVDVSSRIGSDCLVSSCSSSDILRKMVGHTIVFHSLSHATPPSHRPHKIRFAMDQNMVYLVEKTPRHDLCAKFATGCRALCVAILLDHALIFYIGYAFPGAFFAQMAVESPS
ncbi:MAG: hypothetical protein K8S14_07885, partial [Actinomycetia bacterium]|nr:hypothetical protein [Actinomycetes bacterium]